MRPDPTATRRLAALVDRPEQTGEPEGSDPDRYQWGVRPGWTPGEPAGGRHRDEVTTPRWKVGWRAGLLFVLVIGAVIAVLGAWAATQGAGTVVANRETAPAPTSPTLAATGTPLASSATASPTGAAPAPTPTDVVVHVVGAVARPGVVTVAPGARVQDALDAAGGPLPEADLTTVNLARPVQDGEQIPVPRPGETLTPAAAPGSTSGVAGAGGEAGSDGPADGGTPGLPVDVNTASQADLETLPGVGPVLAGRIVQWRTENGSFMTVDDLGEVQGIGDKVLANLRPHVTV